MACMGAGKARSGQAMTIHTRYALANIFDSD
jgi:hypothetical protein